MRVETKFNIGEIVWDVLLSREDVITNIVVYMERSGTVVRYKMENHTSYENEDRILKIPDPSIVESEYIVVEIDSIPHCEESSCSLGSLQVICPYCSEFFYDYDNWIKYDELGVLKFTCEACKKDFTTQYIDFEWRLV
jgi:hypothetical protein